jgi:hypothetical protein
MLSEKRAGLCGSMYRMLVPTWVVFEDPTGLRMEAAVGKHLQPDFVIFYHRQRGQVSLYSGRPVAKNFPRQHDPRQGNRTRRTGERSSG